MSFKLRDLNAHLILFLSKGEEEGVGLLKEEFVNGRKNPKLEGEKKKGGIKKKKKTVGWSSIMHKENENMAR